MCAILENIKSSGEDIRQPLGAVRTRFSYLSLNTTIKMLYTLWRKGIDAHTLQQLTVSKLVPIHRQHAPTVNRDGIGESLWTPRLQKRQALSGYLVHAFPADTCRARSPFIRPWCIIRDTCDCCCALKGALFCVFWLCGNPDSYLVSEESQWATKEQLVELEFRWHRERTPNTIPELLT